MSLPGNISLLARLPSASSQGYGNVDGPASSTDNAVVRFDGTTGKLIQNSVVIMSDVGDVAIPSTATAGFQLFNTADQVTNYEKLQLYWSSNAATIAFLSGGTGTARSLRVTGASGYTEWNSSASTGIIQQTSLVNIGANGTFVATSFTNTATSGTNYGVRILPTYNQASGTAANYDLLVNRTQTAVGSGAQRLISLQVGSAAKFEVDNLGNTAVGAATLSATTALITPASTTGVSSIRLPHGAAPTAPVDGDMWTTTAGLFVRINGSTVGPLS